MGSWNVGLIEKAFADAAVDSGRWVEAMEAAALQTGSFGAVLIPVTGRGPTPNIPFTDSLHESVDSYFRDGWHLRDERFRGVPLMIKRGVVDDLDIAHSDRIARQPYYQEFLAPLGLRWFAGVRIACGEDVWCLSIQRSIAQGPFAHDEKLRLAKLSSRLSSSAALARAMGKAAAVGALDAFEMGGMAVVLIDRQGEVFRVNQSAERLLTGDVRIYRRRLVARDVNATAALDRALDDLLWKDSGSVLSPPVPLPRRRQRPLLAYPVKLSSMASNALADCQCAVVLVGPEKRPRPPEAALQASFRLSDAEARLAARLASGESLAAVAEQLGIAKETSRSQLKSIFVKTGTHRQTELIALLSPLLGISRLVE